MPPLPWPPSSTYLLSKQRDIPPLLLIFTKALLSSKKNSTFCSERLIDSLCHDICYNLTNGQWKTLKHLLLGNSLRHITGSSKVVTSLDRLGHCVSHSTLLELETAMCDSVKENDSNLKSGAAKQAVKVLSPISQLSLVFRIDCSITFGLRIFFYGDASFCLWI